VAVCASELQRCGASAWERDRGGVASEARDGVLIVHRRALGGADAFRCRGWIQYQRTGRDRGHDAAGVNVDRQRLPSRDHVEHYGALPGLGEEGDSHACLLAQRPHDFRGAAAQAGCRLDSACDLDHRRAEDVTAAAAETDSSRIAVEADRLVPPSGNLWIGGQQIWLGPALAGRIITIWADETVLHVMLDGTRLKTLPSRLGVIELARLAADGARPAGPSPLPAGAGTAVEVERMVNGTGLVGLAGRQLNVGYELAGQRVTLRMDGTQMTMISHDGLLLRTLPCPVPPADRHRLRGARRAASMPAPPTGPIIVQRRVSQRGSIMVARQKIHVGMIHARKIVTVTASDHSFLLDIDGETVGIVARTSSREIHRYKAYATQRPARR
jgi:hypothetical protein